MRKIDMIVIHCSATRCDRDYPFERLDSDHRSRGWNGCGYHRYITKDGTVHIGRPYEQVGAHVGPKFNPHSIGICYEGGLTPEGRPADTRTEAQKRSMAALIRDLQKRFPKARLLGHRDLPRVRKDCPCYDVRADLAGGESSPEEESLPEIRGSPYPGLDFVPTIRLGLSRGLDFMPAMRLGLSRGLNFMPAMRLGLSRGLDFMPAIRLGLSRGLNFMSAIRLGLLRGLEMMPAIRGRKKSIEN